MEVYGLGNGLFVGEVDFVDLVCMKDKCVKGEIEEGWEEVRG